MSSDFLKVVSDRTEQIEGIMQRLPKGPGGPYDGGMEQRVRQLETDMSFIKGKLEDMPTKDWMNTRMLAYFGITLAIIGVMIKFL